MRLPWQRRSSEVFVNDLLGGVEAIQRPGTRIGCPDEPTSVSIRDPQRFARALNEALVAFDQLRSDSPYLVDAHVNTYHSTVGIRFVKPGPDIERSGQIEPSLEVSFRSLRSVVKQNGGDLHYWGGTNFLDVSLPFHGPMREAFPDVEHLPWDERYRCLLERATWESLRRMVFRFSNLAESFAARCVELRASRVLVPSVGICVHPWIFADRGLGVVATDAAASAISAVADPGRWPRLYSRAACERWDIGQAASYASQGNPARFASMPELADHAVRESLGQRIKFVLADWADIPLERSGVDAVFATNALPRNSAAERVAVLKEWIRVVRPGGIAFIAQHNFLERDVESVLLDAGWRQANILGAERMADNETTRFQVYYSSG
jgi:SAM-dependent methyltransferase